MDTNQVKELVEIQTQEVNQFIEASAIANITDQDSYDKVLDTAKQIKLKAKDLEEKRKSITKPLDESKKIVMELFNKPINMLQMFENGLKKTMIAYINKKEQERLKEQKRRDEEAAKEKKKLEDKAKKEEDKGKTESAEITREIASSVVAPVVDRKVEKGGVYTVKRYTTVVQDKVAFLKWVVDSKMLEYVTVNVSQLNREAQGTKGERQWPGIKIVATDEPRMR